LLLVGPHLASGTHGGGGHGRFRYLAVERVRDAAAVHELHEHFCAPRVDRVGDAFPGRDLFRRVNAGCAAVALAGEARLGTLGNDQSGTGALGVVVTYEGLWNPHRICPVPGERRHDDAVLQLEVVEAGRRKEAGHLMNSGTGASKQWVRESSSEGVWEIQQVLGPNAGDRILRHLT
jgi:hypothetical protein